MGILGRLGTVIKSNLNSLVDQAEDPEKMIGNTISEMESEVKKARRELVSTLGAAKRLEKKAAELEQEADDWHEKATLAVRQGDDELAREALRRKAKSLAEAERVRGQAAGQATSADDMKAALDRVEQKIDELKARRSTLASQVRHARDGSNALSTESRFGSGPFAELERMGGQIDQLDAEVEAHSVLEDPQRTAVDARFREREKSAVGGHVDDELANLKKKLGG